MVSRYVMGLFCLFLTLQGQADDPFDHTQRQLGETNSKTKSATKCVFNEPILAAESTFEQLKLVGVVLYKNAPEALFLDMRQQLVIAKQGVRLAQEGYLLERIRKANVTFLRVKNGQCEQIEAFDLRF